jgi:LPXTG-site transpeptidase (sortase) family protein
VRLLGPAVAALVLAAGCGYGGVPAAEAPPVNGDPITAVDTVEVATPVSLTIPALKVTDDVVPVGLCAKKDPPRCDEANALELPDVSQVGWYDLAPRPGDVGRAVIAGHVDWLGSPGAFKHLGNLKPGDTFTVKGDNGTELTFAVYKVQPKLKKTEYATVTVPLVFSPTTDREAALITCSGTVSGGQYSDNTVVLARLVTS